VLPVYLIIDLTAVDNGGPQDYANAWTGKGMSIKLGGHWAF
jgi:hypothetical protein